MNDQRASITAELKLTLANSRSSGDALILQVLELLVRNLRGTWGAYWIEDKKSGLLRFNQDWHISNFDVTGLDGNLKQRTFESGEGMPGIVWRMKRAEWSRDIIKDMMLPRSLRAHNLGLDAGMWIPVIDKNNIFGVIEILGHRNELLTNGLAQFLQSIGEEVGHRLASGFES